MDRVPVTSRKCVTRYSVRQLDASRGQTTHHSLCDSDCCTRAAVRFALSITMAITTMTASLTPARYMRSTATSGVLTATTD